MDPDTDPESDQTPRLAPSLLTSIWPNYVSGIAGADVSEMRKAEAIALVALLALHAQGAVTYSLVERKRTFLDRLIYRARVRAERTAHEVTIRGIERELFAMCLLLAPFHGSRDPTHVSVKTLIRAWIDKDRDDPANWVIHQTNRWAEPFGMFSHNVKFRWFRDDQHYYSLRCDPSPFHNQVQELAAQVEYYRRFEPDLIGGLLSDIREGIASRTTDRDGA